MWKAATFISHYTIIYTNQFKCIYLAHLRTTDITDEISQNDAHKAPNYNATKTFENMTRQNKTSKWNQNSQLSSSIIEVSVLRCDLKTPRTEVCLLWMGRTYVLKLKKPDYLWGPAWTSEQLKAWLSDLKVLETRRSDKSTGAFPLGAL